MDIKKTFRLTEEELQQLEVGYTEKMTALYFGFRKRDERGKYRVILRK
ncbi:TPA: hypothetical protein TU266_001968 [Streptococcus equi subsp. zooepidemicus]|nr:hypothetical protein [Streptococcus equi subsp. zooepidemicus]